MRTFNESDIIAEQLLIDMKTNEFTENIVSQQTEDFSLCKNYNLFNIEKMD
jgi:hypothetical protein